MKKLTMSKTPVAVLLAIAMLFTVVMPTSATAAEEKSPELLAAETLWMLGLLHGIGVDKDGNPNFALDLKLSRMQGFIVFVRLMGAEDRALAGGYTCPFSDVYSNHDRNLTAYAYARGWAKGTSPTTFTPTAPMTAAQFLTLMLRILEYKDDIDFKWSTAWELTDKLEITFGEYSADNNEITRGGMAVVFLRVLMSKFKDSDQTLLNKLISDGVISEPESGNGSDIDNDSKNSSGNGNGSDSNSNSGSGSGPSGSNNSGSSSGSGSSNSSGSSTESGDSATSGNGIGAGDGDNLGSSDNSEPGDDIGDSSVCCDDPGCKNGADCNGNDSDCCDKLNSDNDADCSGNGSDLNDGDDTDCCDISNCIEGTVCGGDSSACCENPDCNNDIDCGSNDSSNPDDGAADVWPKSLLDVTDEGMNTQPGHTGRWVKVRNVHELPVGRDADGNELRHTDAIKTDSLYMRQQTRAMYRLDRQCNVLSFTAYNTTEYTARVQVLDFETKIVLWSANLGPGSSLHVPFVDISKTTEIEFAAVLTNAPIQIVHYYDAVYLCDPLVDRFGTGDGFDPDYGATPGDGIVITHAFTDVNFLAEVRSIIGKPDGDIYLSDVAPILFLNLHGKGIASLDGIEYFTALETLSCGENQFTKLDLSGNTALINLISRLGQLTELDVSGNTALKHLSIDFNLLTSLDVTHNTKLELLFVNDNSLTEIDLSNNAKLTDLDVSGNNLMGLDVSNNPALSSLYCNRNGLGSLDLTNNSALAILNCWGNQLTELLLPHSGELTSVDAHDNKLDALDVSRNTELDRLFVNGNNLTSLDLTNNTVLTWVNCHRNQLTELLLPHSGKLHTVNASNNRLATLDVSLNPELAYIDGTMNQLTEINVSNNPALVGLYVGNNRLMELNLSNNPALNMLLCNDNWLTEIDLSSSPELEAIHVQRNDLTELDVSHCLRLVQMFCDGNRFPSADAVKLPPGVEWGRIIVFGIQRP